MDADELYMLIGVLYAKNVTLEADKLKLIEAMRLAQEAREKESTQTTGEPQEEQK